MAFIRICYLVVILNCLPITAVIAQIVYYPANSSQLLRFTAADVAGLLQKAIAGSQFSTQTYGNIVPASGIMFTYDSTITDNQLCTVSGNGSSMLRFTAAEDNGLVFGVYQYLDELGFKFYQPGEIWEVIPAIGTAFKNINKEYNSAFKYKSWFISGGHRTWAMDKVNSYSWESYSGENGHNWSLYQRRNGMSGAYRFAGHRGDIINGTYLTTLQTNPCYVASHNGSRQASSSSVPDIYNEAAINLWASTIEQKFTHGKNTILNNKVLYVNQYRNFNYGNQNIGIEVPDGPRWGNSRDSLGCTNIDYVTESDQSILLANSTVQKIKTNYPDRRFQLYGYYSHANIPSSAIKIDPSIDVQVVSTAFQNETSSKGLLSRWYKKHSAISEYHYFNIPQWTGETPMTFLSELKGTVQRLHEQKSQGIVWEASPAKFASLPYLRAANENLLHGTDIDSSLATFCRDMFGKASLPVYELLHQWAADEAVTAGYFAKDNKYKIPLYLQLLQQAVNKTNDSDEIIRRRLAELKAYLHYLVLYYDWFYDPGSAIEKAGKGGLLCIYLAKINKLVLVNSYYLITGIANQFGAGSALYLTYNVQNGTAYKNGELPLITDSEIETNFQQDLANIAGSIDKYELQTAREVTSKIQTGNLVPAEKIYVSLGYTNGANYPNRSAFSVYAKRGGSFSIKYSSQFNMPGKGYINFTLESAGKALSISKDTSLSLSAKTGSIHFELPEEGHYTLYVVSKFQSSVQLEITTNQNVFYKSSPFTHRYAEKYTSDPLSLPGSFFVPAGMQKVYFNVNNSYSVNKGFLTPQQVSNEFLIKDNYGKAVVAISAGEKEPTLFYINIPQGQSGAFWQISRIGQYFICFANISNILWYGKLKPCIPVDFSISVRKTGDECLTLLRTNSSTTDLKWEVNDAGRIVTFDFTRELLLPASVSPSAVVTLTTGDQCSVTKKIADYPGYLKELESCASAAVLPGPALLAKPLFYPNPSRGPYDLKLNLPGAKAEIIIISDMLGRRMAIFYNVSHIEITHLPAGCYSYLLVSAGEKYKGHLIKL